VFLGALPTTQSAKVSGIRSHAGDGYNCKTRTYKCQQALVAFGRQGFGVERAFTEHHAVILLCGGSHVAGDFRGRGRPGMAWQCLRAGNELEIG
jgi:hypothetical protein